MENGGEEVKIDHQDVANQDAAPPSELAQEPHPMEVDGVTGDDDEISARVRIAHACASRSNACTPHSAHSMLL